MFRQRSLLPTGVDNTIGFVDFEHLREKLSYEKKLILHCKTYSNKCISSFQSNSIWANNLEEIYLNFNKFYFILYMDTNLDSQEW